MCRDACLAVGLCVRSDLGASLRSRPCFACGNKRSTGAPAASVRRDEAASQESDVVGAVAFGIQANGELHESERAAVLILRQKYCLRLARLSREESLDITRVLGARVGLQLAPQVEPYVAVGGCNFHSSNKKGTKDLREEDPPCPRVSVLRRPLWSRSRTSRQTAARASACACFGSCRTAHS